MRTRTGLRLKNKLENYNEKAGKTMKIQITTDYAIRILQFLHENRGELHTATRIAEAIRITYPFYMKIANLLKQSGLLKTELGRNGGYKLGRPAHKISLYDVYLCVEGNLQIKRCFKESEDAPCTNGPKEHCKLRKFLEDLQDEIVASMSEVSIADLVGSGKGDTRKARQRNRAATNQDLQI